MVPFAAGAFTGLGASTYHLLDFPSKRLPALLYRESLTLLEIVDRPRVVREHAVAHHEAQRAALSREDTLTLIREAETEL